MICCDEKLSENRNVEKQLMLKLSTTRGFSAEPGAVLRASVETLRQLYYCCADQLNFLAALLPTAELRLLFSLVLWELFSQADLLIEFWTILQSSQCFKAVFSVCTDISTRLISTASKLTIQVRKEFLLMSCITCLISKWNLIWYWILI